MSNEQLSMSNECTIIASAKIKIENRGDNL